MGRTSTSRAVLIETITVMMWENNYGSLTIDAICARAGVNKGSFYHFFHSKSDLAIAAIELRWETRKAAMDKLFSPVNPPLQRLKLYFDEACAAQLKLFAQGGSVLGCPDFSLGSELCATETEVADRVNLVLKETLNYFELAIADADKEQTISVDNAKRCARQVLSFYEGVLTLARIRNEPRLLEDIWPGTLKLLGATPKRADNSFDLLLASK